MDTEVSRRDILLHIVVQMEELVPAGSATGPEWDEMMLRFGEAADGLFIWASMADELVRSSCKLYKKICAIASNESGPKSTLRLTSYVPVLSNANVD